MVPDNDKTDDPQRGAAGPAEGGGSNATPADQPQTGAEILSLTDQLRTQATTHLFQQKERAVAGLSSLVHAVRETGQQLRQKDQAGIAGYVEQAAEQLDRFSQGLGQKDFTEVLNDVQQFARRQPAVFLGLGFGLGLIGARFLKSSRPRGGASGSSGAPYRGSYAGAPYASGSFGAPSYAGRSEYGAPGSFEGGAGDVAAPRGLSPRPSATAFNPGFDSMQDPARER